ncbi:hypothetical protein EZ449_20495 [Pedobacter frigidisoli]|uniref:Uncharacterized protein n=1 Tax=Pedobacter frigidisoli TaxID=2530455 RepID=A0A4V2ML37_9SPHI|nr:hypothetical protein [Pedobacter frigidisoli]TCD00627.1 hypothetical protein EZ449_20495 [Pedobacter frigidisoli]
MKTALFLFAFMAFGKMGYCQQVKQSIDYQYFRDDKSYYAFELFKNSNNGMDDQLMINFTSNSSFKKIEKIYVKAGEVELRLKFKVREETVKSDNPEQKFYPIVFNGKDLENKKLPCNAQIIFKLDNGTSYSLPFSTCNVIEFIAKN